MSYQLLSCRALCDNRAFQMLPVSWLIHTKNRAMETYSYSRSLMIVNACMCMHFKDERICTDTGLFIKTSILKKVQKDALPCALIVHVNCICKQREAKLRSGGKHLKNKKNKATVLYWQV